MKMIKWQHREYTKFNPCTFIETTALGAAYLAGLATGYWKDKEEIRANWQLQRSFMPSIGETKRKQKLKGWKKAVRCALFWANDEEE